MKDKDEKNVPSDFPSGTMLTFPNTKDANGEYEWVYKPKEKDNQSNGSS